jgi:hypothetical protein
LAAGTTPPCHVAALDHGPLCTVCTPGRDVSSEKSGMLSGSVAAPAPGVVASTANNASVAIRVGRACNPHGKMPPNRRIVDMPRQSRKSSASSGVCSSLDEPESSQGVQAASQAHRIDGRVMARAGTLRFV